ncbi:transglycosylase SLT domain-containing protein [Oryzomonas rubra]|uniref:Transglycosylase SLT domain-containing protein n=1 Tax=Oryzomonas rubra TaxID=2509454 RepID=A0A5A9X725_9BACT|nr:transglycosylase SLT domain-containing protein [Oryzomonas rubra]KAA0888770.1 hypothetical protein ET418_15430 [Oryzomonas rubra]
MGLSIDLKVNGTEKVLEATKAVGGFKTEMEKAESHTDIKMNVPGLGDSKNLNGMRSANELAKSYRKEMDASRRAVAEMAKDYDKLIKLPKPYNRSDIEGLHKTSPKAQYYARAAEINKSDNTPAQKRQTAAEQYYAKHGDYGQVAPGRRENGTDDPNGGSSAFKKALGWSLAAVGGFSILGFLAQSRAKYQQSVGHEATLGARGIKDGFEDGAGLGMDSLEYMGLMEHVSQSAGMSGDRAKGATRLSAAFGRAYGVDPSMAAGMYGTMYQATGNANMGVGAIATMEQAVKKGMDKARMSELMNMVARNTNITATAMHGAGASDAQAGTAAALASAVMALKDGTSYKQYAKSSEFMNVAQNGFKSAGTAPGEILLWKALGGFNGELTEDKLYDIEKAREEGPIMHPDALHNIIKDVGVGTTKKGQSVRLKKLIETWGLTTQSADALIKLDDSGILTEAARSGKDLKHLKTGTKREREMAARMEAAYGTLPGADKLNRMARTSNLEVKTGEIVDRIVAPIQEAILKAAETVMNRPEFKKMIGMTDSLFNFGTTAPSPSEMKTTVADKMFINTHGYREMITDAARRRGIDPAEAIALAATENPKFDPMAISPNGQGVGLFQDNPKYHGTVKQLQDPFRNTAIGLKILADAKKKYPNDPEKALLAYSGHLDSNGNPLPGSRAYLKRYRNNLYREKTASLFLGGEQMTTSLTNIDPEKVPSDSYLEKTNGGKGINQKAIGMSQTEGAVMLQGTDKLITAIETLTNALGEKKRYLGAQKLNIGTN